MSALLDLASYYLPVLGAALLVGVLTARWAFRRPPAPQSKAEDSSQT